MRNILIQTFGGLTAFTRAPAQGSEQASGGNRRDDLIFFEVMTEPLDALWWTACRMFLEATFRQKRLIVRPAHVTLL